MSAPRQPVSAPKQIRFVNTPGQPPSKRRRINAACLTCRKKKTRCAGERPACSTCAKNGHGCLGYADLDRTGHDEAGARGPPADAPSGAGKRVEGRGSTVPPSHRDRRTSETRAVGSRRFDTSPTHGTQNRPRPSPSAQRPSVPQSPPQAPAESHRVPYFRYFGPTAIVPGYKQMVVDVSNRTRRRSHGSVSHSSPSSSLASVRRTHSHSSGQGADELPVYDPSDAAPVDPVVLNLVKTFFMRLGCNYPFLREARVLRQIRDKSMEPILVDAMCALAARFSDLPVLAAPGPRSAYGTFYAQRAKAATVDTFPCPSVAAVQACLLMAYEGFGADQDSALWMYLGIAIRMAVDLGLQKKIVSGTPGCVSEPGGGDDDKPPPDHLDRERDEEQDEEQERRDTFWAVFFLDRVISSGTGRPVTLRDDDYELALPETHTGSRWPAPFPVLARIVQLYGRVSDVLNTLRSADDLTEDKMGRLARMEGELTQLYQRQDARLGFSAPNFQAYVRAGQGTTFILLHFWFHALVVVLHQPALLAPFAHTARTRQLLPNSHALSMSSAKTIADILAFAELIDPTSFVGNPFTSQPMYIAACAFLAESVRPAHGAHGAQGADDAGKHALLASSANQNYQRCYASLQQLHRYWGGVRYILSALDQKAKGIWDVETFTPDELDTDTTDTTDTGRAGTSTTAPPPVAYALAGTSSSDSPSLTMLFQSHSQNVWQAQAPFSTAPHSTAPLGHAAYDPVRYPAPAFPRPTLSAVRYAPRAPLLPASLDGYNAPYRTSAPGHVGHAGPAGHAGQAGRAGHCAYDTLPGLVNSLDTDTLNSLDTDTLNSLDTALAPELDLADPFALLQPGATFEHQEIDIRRAPDLADIADIMPQWLEYLPSNVVHLFDGYEPVAGSSVTE